MEFDTEEPKLIVDLGAGSGQSTRTLVDAVDDRSRIIAVEPSESELALARKALGSYIRDERVALRLGRGEALTSVLAEPVDVVVFFNGIHLVDDKPTLVREIKSSLRPGGAFGFNTSFYCGGEPAHTLPFYRRWTRQSRHLLRDRYDLRVGKDKVTARQRLNAEQYRKLLEDQGFVIECSDFVTVPMPIEAFADLSRYSLWINGLLPGIELSIGQDVLLESLDSVSESLGIDSVERSWLTIKGRLKV